MGVPSLFPLFMKGGGSNIFVQELVLELDAMPDIEVDTTPVEVTVDLTVEVTTEPTVEVEVS